MFETALYLPVKYLVKGAMIWVVLRSVIPTEVVTPALALWREGRGPELVEKTGFRLAPE
jgi:hypothetical protein